jgi:hypothetical protein
MSSCSVHSPPRLQIFQYKLTSYGDWLMHEIFLYLYLYGNTNFLFARYFHCISSSSNNRSVGNNPTPSQIMVLVSIHVQ